MHPGTASTNDNDVTILARILGNDPDALPPETARYFLGLEFNPRDRACMPDLAVRNQEGALSAKEREVLFAFAKAGTLLTILKSKARRALKLKSRKDTRS